MPKKPAAAVLEESKSPVESARDVADAMYRAATECCRQHDRVSRILAKSDLETELSAVLEQCDSSDEALCQIVAAYEKTAANVRPVGADEGWWHRANALWLASREYVRRQGSCDASTRQLQTHDRERLGKLHAEYELEASALLALRQAADAYRRDRPSAA